MPDLAEEFTVPPDHTGNACVVVLGTGGTIAGTGASATAPLDYRAGVVPVAQLLADLPSVAGLSVRTEQLAQIDSKDMSEAVWRSLADRCAALLAEPQVRGIVITHGTDTVEETAFLLHQVLPPGPKPVVLTCAMRPATDLAPDGPRNIADALTVARTPGATGVLLVCAGRIHHAVAVSKVHHYRLDPFDSGDAGPLGTVEDGQVRLARPWPQDGGEHQGLALPEGPWPWVEIVTSHAGARGTVVDRLCELGVAGIVAAGTGNGSVHAALDAALLRAQSRGIEAWRSSRCAFARVLPGRAHPLPTTSLAPVKARIALQLQLLATAPAVF